MQDFLLAATIYLCAAVVAVPIAARLGFGSVLGYLAAGMLIGPVLGLVGNAETRDLQHVAEFGVVIMLFLIGLELDPRALWDMRHRLVGLGGLQIGVTLLAVAGVAIALGQGWQPALALGMVFALSSTAIVLQTLTEKGLMQTAGGRAAFAVLLAQDIAVLPMLAAIPLLATLPARHGGEEEALSLVEGLPGWQAALVTLGAVAVLILAGTYLTRPLFRFIHRARLREMYTAFALLLVVGVALLMSAVGLSPALGTFVAGVMLGNSEFRHEIETDLEPFKGLFLGLYFITVGAGTNFAVIAAQPGLVAGLTLGLILLKGAILYLLARAAGLAGRDRILFTLGLAQAGEFGFVLVAFALQQGVFPPATGQVVLIVIALSMLVTPLLFLVFEWTSRRVGPGGQVPAPDRIDRSGPVIIAGVGRFGQVVNRLLRSTGFETVVLDNDLATIETMRRFGFRGFFGDPTRPDILRAAGIGTARVLVVALDKAEDATRLVRYARRLRPDLTIIARARDRIHVFELHEAGATKTVREVFDSSLRAGRYALESLGLSDYEAAQAEMGFYHLDRAGLAELAALWKPGVPLEQNREYMERSRQLNADLETALMARLGQGAVAAAPGDGEEPQVLTDPYYQAKD